MTSGRCHCEEQPALSLSKGSSLLAQGDCFAIARNDILLSRLYVVRDLFEDDFLADKSLSAERSHFTINYFFAVERRQAGKQTTR